MDRARFSFVLTLHDRYGTPLHMAVDLDQELRISTRAVDDLKVGADLGMPLMSFDGAVRLMKAREFRKDLFIRTAGRLAAQMAERMEDAEGWNDTSRIGPARKQLGGDWK